VDYRSLSSDIIPISPDELSVELARRCGENRDAKEIWAIKFLRRYRDSGGTAQDALELAIRCTHWPTELQHFLFRVYSRDFTDAHAEAVRDFGEFCHGAQLIVVHVSCQARVQLASASARSFGDQEGLRHLIVVGQSTELQTPRYSFDPSGGVLTLPAPDTYEGLAQKMAILFRFLGFGGNTSCVMKLDDDIRCVASKFSTQAIVELTQRYDYLGRVNEAGRYGIHRWWHLGKCKNDELNHSPYSMLADCNYANGPAYFLSPSAINILAKASVYLCQAFQVEFSYEDVAVGKILKSFGVYPHHYDPLEAGILTSTDEFGSALEPRGGE
jgi:hypothetical protein